MEQLFLISSGCSDVYSENTRSHFRNDLPRDIISNTGVLYLTIESIAFDKTFKSYSSEFSTPDLILLIGNDKRFILSFSKCYSLREICEKINNFIQRVRDETDVNDDIGSCEYKNSKIEITLYSNQLLLSKNFYDFLRISSEEEIELIEDKEYYRLRKSDNEEKIVFSSLEKIQINENLPDSILVECMQIAPYYKNSEICRVIGKVQIPQSEIQSSTFFYNFPKKNFFKLETSNIRTFEIRLLQNNGEKIYFDYGSPVIIKCSLKTMPEKDFFYLSVSSEKSETYPENNISHFQNELVKEYLLNGEWKVAVTDIYIPSPRSFIAFDEVVYEIPKGEEYFCVVRYAAREIVTCKRLPANYMSKKELVAWLLQEFTEFFTILIDDKENIFFSPLEKSKEIDLQIFTSYSIFEIINSHSRYVKVPQFIEDLIWAYKFDNVRQRISNQKKNILSLQGFRVQESVERLLTETNSLTMIDAVTFYNFKDFKNINVIDVDRKRLLNIKNMEWKKKEEMRIIDYSQKNNLLVQNEVLPSYFFLYADFVGESIMADKFVNIIKFIPYRNGNNNHPGGFFTFNNYDYYNVSKTNLRNLEFKVKTQSGNDYNFFPNNDEIRMTLKFIRVK